MVGPKTMLLSSLTITSIVVIRITVFIFWRPYNTHASISRTLPTSSQLTLLAILPNDNFVNGKHRLALRRSSCYKADGLNIWRKSDRQQLPTLLNRENIPKWNSKEGIVQLSGRANARDSTIAVLPVSFNFDLWVMAFCRADILTQSTRNGPFLGKTQHR